MGIVEINVDIKVENKVETTSENSNMPDVIGRVLGGRYEILNLIGEGGMAEVYRARHVQLDRLVAVKVMLEFLVRELNFTQRFEREARFVAQLQHPNIIQVYDFDSIPSQRLYYMVVELLKGPSLGDRLAELSRTGEQLPIEELLRITRSVASALAYAHQHNMIHRDIKPGNVMLDGQRVVLTDFGVAKMVVHENSGNFTTSGALLGTPAYMAPEHGLGQLGDSRSDLYSLGVMMYQMATNVLPFSADTPIALVLRHINDIVEPPRLRSANLPIGVEAIIMRLLEKEPSHRYQTADELLHDLENPERVASYVPAPVTQLPKHTEHIAQVALTPPQSAPAQVSRRGPLAILAIVVLALLIIGGIWITRGITSSGKSGGSTATGTAIAAVITQAATQPVILPPMDTPTATEPLTQIPSVAASETQTKMPTDTPTDGPSAIETAQADNTQGPCKFTSTREVAIRLQTQPDPFSQAMDMKILSEETVDIIGVFRNTPDQKTWWQVQIEDEVGWVPEDIGAISGNCLDVPEVVPERN